MKNEKYMRVALKNGDFTKVKTTFSKEPFTPEEFTCLIMALLESYTERLLVNNDRKAVYEHFNNAFGIFLNKILPEEDIYKVSEAHKEFKENADKILDRPLSLEEAKEDETNRMAAYLLAGDILQKELGLDRDSVDLILNKRLNLIQ